MDIYIYIFKFASVAFNAWVPQGFRLVWGAMGGGAAGRARAGWAKGQGRPEGGAWAAWGPDQWQTRSGGPGVLALVHIIHIYINIHKHIIHTYESTQKHCYTPRHAPQPTCDLYVVASSGVKRFSRLSDSRLRLTVVQVAAVLDISYMACV